MIAQQRWTSEWYAATPDAGQRVRLLIEGPETAWFEAFTQYRAKGYEVAVCTGPDVDGYGCTLLTDGHCPLAERADVVLSTVDVDQPACRQLLVEIARHHPGRPLIVEPDGQVSDVDEHIATVRAAVN